MVMFDNLAIRDRVAAPLRQQAIEACRNAITTGVFAPGQRLAEKDLCERLAVSRSVVRETLRHLEAEGLVTVIANRGPVVATLTEADAAALFELRAQLEGFAGQLCAERATPAQRQALRSSLLNVAAAMAEGDLNRLLRAKDQFYAVLAAGAQNPFLENALKTMLARVQAFRALSLSAPGRSADTLAELERIVGAIERSDAAAARKACEAHVGSAAAVARGRLQG